MIGKKVTMIEVREWDKLVQDTYARPYSLQQQDGCKSRGIERFSLPISNPLDFERDFIPHFSQESDEMGVSFNSWLSMSPEQIVLGNDEHFLGNDEHFISFTQRLWWKRQFYPSLEMIASDLHKKGILPDGEYAINIDW